MTQNHEDLPTTIEGLKAMLLKERQQYADSMALCNFEIQRLQEQLNLYIRRRFAPSTEQWSGTQPLLFNEAETDSVIAKKEAQSTTVSSHERKVGGRKPLPDNLPEVVIEHDLPEAERVCANPACQGKALKRIGKEVMEQLEIIPAKMHVLRHVRYKYACPCCEGNHKTAPMDPQPIPKSMAAPGFLAHIAVSKYVDALPLYRQEQILARQGIDLSRGTMAQWMMSCGELVLPLLNLFWDRMLSSKVINIDETPIQVLKEKGRKAGTKSYMWVVARGDPGEKLFLYEYSPSRGGEVPLRLLADFKGYVQCDDYSGYDALAAKPSITTIGCWAHVRRRFNDAVKALPATSREAEKKPICLVGFDYVQELYRLDREIRDASPEERLRHRHEKSKPLLDEIRRWLGTVVDQVPPKSLTGKALSYLYRDWERLSRFVNDPILRLDNNAAENAIRPFVVGRKNWLFSDQPRGASASAALYSIVATARGNGHNPYEYLKRIFTELPKATTVAEVEKLLPWNITPALA